MLTENIKLPKPIKGYKLAKAVESAMDELFDDLETWKERICEYNPETEIMEVNQSLKAKRRFTWADLLKPIKVWDIWSFSIPVYGPLLYLINLLDYDYSIQAEKIELNSIYNNLNLEVTNFYGKPIKDTNTFYEDAKGDFKDFTKDLNQELGKID